MNETLNETLNRVYQRLLQNIHNEPYCNRVIIMIKKEFGLDWREEINNVRLKLTNDIDTSGKRKFLKEVKVKRKKRERYNLSTLALKLKIIESSYKHNFGLNDIYYIDTLDLDLIVEYIKDIKKMDCKYHHFERMASLTRHILKKIKKIEEIKTIKAMFIVTNHINGKEVKEVKEWIFYTTDYPYIVIIDLNMLPPSEYYTGPPIMKNKRIFEDCELYDVWVSFFEVEASNHINFKLHIKPILLNPLKTTNIIKDYARYLIAKFGFKPIHSIGMDSPGLIPPRYTLEPRTRITWFISGEQLNKHIYLEKYTVAMYYFGNSAKKFGNIINYSINPAYTGIIFNNFFLREFILKPEKTSKFYNVNDRIIEHLESYLNKYDIKNKVLDENKNIWIMISDIDDIICYILIDAWVEFGDMDSLKNKITIQTSSIYIKKFNSKQYLVVDDELYPYIDDQDILYKLSKKNEDKLLKIDLDMKHIKQINLTLSLISKNLFYLMKLSHGEIMSTFNEDREIKNLVVNFGRVMFFSFLYSSNGTYKYKYLGKKAITINSTERMAKFFYFPYEYTQMIINSKKLMKLKKKIKVIASDAIALSEIGYGYHDIICISFGLKAVAVNTFKFEKIIMHEHLELYKRYNMCPKVSEAEDFEFFRSIGVFVIPTMRRQGLGTEIANMAEKFVQNKGVNWMSLYPNDSAVWYWYNKFKYGLIEGIKDQNKYVATTFRSIPERMIEGFALKNHLYKSPMKRSSYEIVQELAFNKRYGNKKYSYEVKRFESDCKKAGYINYSNLKEDEYDNIYYKIFWETRHLFNQELFNTSTGF